MRQIKVEKVGGGEARQQTGGRLRGSERNKGREELRELYDERRRRQMGASSTWNKAGSKRSEERREGTAGAAEVAQIEIKIIQKVAKCDDNPEREPLRLEKHTNPVI